MACFHQLEALWTPKFDSARSDGHAGVQKMKLWQSKRVSDDVQTTKRTINREVLTIEMHTQKDMRCGTRGIEQSLVIM